MRKINGKLFLALLLGTAALTGAVFAVHYFQYQRVARAVLWQANRAEEQGQVERMARYLTRYLEFNPHDDDEKARLGQALAGDTFANSPRDRLRGVRLLDEVLLRDDSRPDLRRLLVKTALDLGRLKLARGHLEKLLPYKDVKARLGEAHADKPAKPDRDRGELEGYWAQLLDGEAKPAEAMACCRLALRHAPDQEASAVRLAYLLRRHKEADPEKRSRNLHEADQVVDALVAANAHSHKAYLARWRYRRDFELLETRAGGDTGKVSLAAAAEDVAAALKRAPEDVDVLLAAADLERMEGGAAQGDARLTPEKRAQAIKEHRDQAFAYLQRGLDLQAKKGKQASDVAQFVLLWHKGNLLLDDLQRLEETPEGDGDRAARLRAKTEEIAQTITQVRKTRGPAAVGLYLQGRLYFHERRWADAVGLFEQARALLASQPTLAAQAHFYLGQCYEKLEEPHQMREAYRALAGLDNQSTVALLGMANADRALGRLDDAMTKFKQVMARGDLRAKTWLDVARLEMQIQLQKDRGREWKDAEEYLKQAEKANPGAVEATLLRASWYVARDQGAEAELELTKARDRQPKEVRLWTALAELHARQKELDKARAVLDAAGQKLGDRVELRLARAGLVIDPADKFPGVAKQLALLPLEKRAEKFGEEDRARLLGGLAEAYLRLNKLSDARRLWREVAKLPRYRTDLRLRMVLFDLALKGNDEPGMHSALAEIRSVERTRGAYHRCGEALRLIWMAKQEKYAERKPQLLDEARLQLDYVLTLRPSWPAVFVARAEVAELSGNPEQAINDLREAVNKGESSPAVIHRLAALLNNQPGRQAEADQLLNRLRESMFVQTDLGRLAATVALRMNQPERALQLAREAVNKDTKDPRELVWLGRVLAATGHPKEAERRLRKAVSLAPAEPMTWVALVRFLANGKRGVDALDAMKEARARLPAAKVPLALAQCHEALGKDEEARKEYERALAAQSDDVAVVRSVATFHLGAGRIAESEPLLRRIVTLKHATPNDVEWARRGLAIVLAAGNDFQRFRQALDLVGVKLDANGRLVRAAGDRKLPTDLRRAQARVLATQGQREFRRRAIELLVELDREHAAIPDDKYVLALLYDADGNWPKCREVLGDLVRSPNASPQYLAQYSERLIRKGDAKDRIEADGYIHQLEEVERERKLEANAFASVELRARLLEARGKGDEAVKLLMKHTSREKARPEEVFLVLASLGRQKRYREAFELVARAWENDKCPPEASGGVSVALLRAMNPTDAQAQRVEKWLKAAIARKPASMALRMHLADMYDLRGRYVEAEALYREVLSKEKGNVVALNNLAWLLAQHADANAEALDHVNRAINGLGRRPDLLDTRGLVQLMLGHTDEALADLKEATAEAPTATRLFHLARAYHQARNRPAATRTLEEARRLGLKVSAVHPKEQAACRTLFTELNVH